MKSEKIRLVLNLAGACFFLLITTACSVEERSTAKRQRIRYEPRYDQSVCALSKYQGDNEVSAGLSHEASQGSSQRIVNAFFDKRYDRSMLESVLNLSAVATGKFVTEALGGRVFRVPRDTTPGEIVCPMFTELTEAPDDLRDLWERYAGTGMAGWRLAGLYFEDCGRQGFSCDDHQMVRPTILIDEARDRWTLVHEMMHFNFSRERKRNPHAPALSQLSLGAQSAKEMIKESIHHYLSSSDKSHLARVQAQYSWLLRQWFYHVMTHTVLEEVAIEATLFDEFLAGRFKNVSVSSLDVALMYMERSYKKLQAEYDSPVIQIPQIAGGLSLRSLRSFLYAEAKKRQWRDIERAVESDVAFYARWEAGISNIISERRARAYEYQYFILANNTLLKERPQNLLAAADDLGRDPAHDRAHADTHVASHFEGRAEWIEFQSWKD